MRFRCSAAERKWFYFKVSKGDIDSDIKAPRDTTSIIQIKVCCSPPRHDDNEPSSHVQLLRSRLHSPSILFASLIRTNNEDHFAATQIQMNIKDCMSHLPHLVIFITRERSPAVWEHVNTRRCRNIWNVDLNDVKHVKQRAAASNVQWLHIKKILELLKGLNPCCFHAKLR